jgi:hypothetical protein
MSFEDAFGMGPRRRGLSRDWFAPLLLDQPPRAQDFQFAAVTRLSVAEPAQTASQNFGHGTVNPKLGALSEKHETSGRGPGTVSSGNGDLGGVSYGLYQLSTKWGRPQEFLKREGKKWAKEFGNAQPGTAEFSKTWKAIAAREPEAFGRAQHDFIQRADYNVLLKMIEKQTGVAMGLRSHALQDALWSTVVQFSPYTGIKVIKKAVAALPQGTLPSSREYDRHLIGAIYDERGRTNAKGELVYFTGSSKDFQKGIAERFQQERREALNMLVSGSIRDPEPGR